MKYISRTVLTFVFVVGTIQLCSPLTMAQFGGDRIKRPLNRPTVSPYVNLFRGGSGSAILNYYGSVRPQQQFYSQDEKFSKDFQDLEQRSFGRQRWNQQDDNKSFRRYRMSITGHKTGFMTIGRGGGGGDEGGGGSGSSGDDDQSSGGRSGHSASFGGGNMGSRF